MPFANVKIHNETKKQCINRLENFLLDRFDFLAKVIIIKHKDTHLAVAILHNSDQHKELINSILNDLKIVDTSDALIFYNFDPQAIHVMEQIRTIHVRNVPCRITKLNLETYFKRFGLIDIIWVRTHITPYFKQQKLSMLILPSLRPFKEANGKFSSWEKLFAYI